MSSQSQCFTCHTPQVSVLVAVLALLLGGIVPGSSQPPVAVPDLKLPDQLVFRAWLTDDGLPHNTVNAIVQTRDGYLWIGTRDGLARFDGVRFTVFGLKEGLPSVEVQSLYEDGQGTLWIGTSGGGLSRWKGGQLETVTFPQYLAASSTVSTMAEDAMTRLWIGTRAGLTIAERGRFAVKGDLARLSRVGIRALLPGPQGEMWVATLSEGLYEFRNDRLRESTGPSGNERILAYCLLQDSRSNLWASVGNGTLLCRQDGQWRRYSEADGLPFAYITCLAQDHEGTIWAGSLDDGLYCLQAGRFLPVRQEQGLSANDVRSLCVDRDGHVWVGTRTGGLNRLSRRKLVSVGVKQGLTNDYTRAVAETRDGRLWVGTTGGGLYCGGPGGFTRIAPFFSSVESVLAAQDGRLWWGAARGLLCLEQDNQMHTYTNEPWLGPAAVTALSEDGCGGLWVGTSEGHLVHFGNGAFVETPEPLARGAITGLAQEPAGALWIGSMAGGLQRLSNDRQTLEQVSGGLASQAIRTLHLDAEGVLWIGTAGGGLSRCERGRIFTFTPAVGLTANTIVQIVEDDDGFLWLGTSRGVLRVRKGELYEVAAGRQKFLHSRSFGVNEGMPAEECSSGFCPAGLKTRAGQICISTVKGLVFFDPRLEQNAAPPRQAILEELLANGQTVQHEPAPMTARTPPLLLPANSRELEFHYTAIDFGAPEKLRFRYQLVGLDPSWFEAGERRTANYHRVPPGRYVFRVLASNADGLWSTDACAVALTIQPYLWETPWFLAGCTLAGLGLMAGAIRLVERRRYRRHLAVLETQHAIERERLRISQDMHDDVGSILTQVSQLSDLGQSDSGGLVAAKATFERIGSQARAAVQALDEIVWATNPKNDNLPRFAEYVSQFADELFENSPIRCWQEVPTSLPKMPLGADLRHNVFLAIKEALNNVLKHAGATEVWLRLALLDSELCVSVEDNGKGFDPAEISTTGNGLVNMRTRLADCGGKTEVQSSPGQGTQVRFCFPIGRAG